MSASVRSESLGGHWSTALLALVLVALYLLLHPYLGIVHDGRLYTLQALNRLHPDLYGNDIFLRYGSQDDYTFFTPLFAWAIAWLGVEPAAAVLTLASQTAFLAAAFLLARVLLPTRAALMALALLLLLPSHYGAQNIFSYLEGFVTPRLLAESLVLGGLAAWLSARRLLAATLLFGAMLIHPIMGLSGLGMLASLAVAIPYWRRLWIPAAIFALLLLAAAVAGWIPDEWRLDPEWWNLVMGRADYVSLFHWNGEDWGRVATVCATLAMGARVLSGPAQRLAAAAIVTTGTLMLLAWSGGDLFRLSIVLQAQPWRVLWLATVIAILILPPLAGRCWQEAGLPRAGLLLLAAAWLVPSEILALVISPLALIAVCLQPRRLDAQQLRLLLAGSWLVLSIVLADALAVSVLAWKTGTYNLAVTPWMDSFRGVSTGGALPLLLMVAGWWICRQAPPRTIAAMCGILALLVAGAAVPGARNWLGERFSDETKLAFADWRARIPPGSDVMWAADRSMGADSAVYSWLLLERPSFVSLIQATTSLFSREAAVEIHRRAQSLLGLLPDIESLYPKNKQPIVPARLELAPVCRSSTVRYIVTYAVFADAQPIDAPADVRAPFRNLKLYICP